MNFKENRMFKIEDVNGKVVCRINGIFDKTNIWPPFNVLIMILWSLIIGDFGPD
jgi:hypothetical protein